MSTLRVNNIQSTTGDLVSIPQGLQYPDGTAASPSVSFSSDTDTGFYRAGANSLGISAGGSQIARIDSQGLEVIDGTASVPSISFLSDTNTGLYRSASDQLSFSTGGVERFRIESTGQIKAVYESQVGTDYNTTMHNGYFCRAWVNFDGTGTVAIRASGNVSSITDNGTGDYTVNFTTAMPDINYSCSGFGWNGTGVGAYTAIVGIRNDSTLSNVMTINNIRIVIIGHDGSSFDPPVACVNTFR